VHVKEKFEQYQDSIDVCCLHHIDFPN